MAAFEEATVGIEPTVEVLQTLTQAIQTLDRLWPDSV